MNPFWQRWMTADASPEPFVCCTHCATGIVRMSLDQYHLDIPLCSHVPKVGVAVAADRKKINK